MEFTGGTFKGIVHPDDQPDVADQITRQTAMSNTGRKTYTDFRARTKGGETKNIVDSGRHVQVDGVGEVCYVLMVDMGERALIQGTAIA